MPERPATTRFKCTECGSTDVREVSSDGTREVVEVRCLRCGAISTIDNENFQLGSQDLPPPAEMP